jgi:hypothetical protein
MIPREAFGFHAFNSSTLWPSLGGAVQKYTNYVYVIAALIYTSRPPFIKWKDIPRLSHFQSHFSHAGCVHFFSVRGQYSGCVQLVTGYRSYALEVRHFGTFAVSLIMKSSGVHNGGSFFFYDLYSYAKVGFNRDSSLSCPDLDRVEPSMLAKSATFIDFYFFAFPRPGTRDEAAGSVNASNNSYLVPPPQGSTRYDAVSLRCVIFFSLCVALAIKLNGDVLANMNQSSRRSRVEVLAWGDFPNACADLVAFLSDRCPHPPPQNLLFIPSKKIHNIWGLKE